MTIAMPASKASACGRCDAVVAILVSQNVIDPVGAILLNSNQMDLSLSHCLFT